MTTFLQGPTLCGGVFPSTDYGDSWTPVTPVWTAATFGLSPSIRSALSLPEQQDVKRVYRSTDNGNSWTLFNIGLTSTDVPALAVSGSNYHIFAGSHSIMGKGDGIFRSTDYGDRWRERNEGFAALDVKSVVINPIGHIFTSASGGLFRSTKDADQWS